jgi:hypothetical protein
MNSAFEFKQCVTLVKATAKKAKSLSELRNLIALGSSDSIAHHTYQYFLKGRIMEYTNDFAHWAGESLEESALAEQLSNIDPYAFPTVELLRSEILRTIDEYRERFPEPREALTRDEFYLNDAVTIVFPAGVRAQNLAEFLMAIKYIDPSSIYYHFYDARVRLAGRLDDFSKWFRNDLGKADLASRITSIDPFMHNLEGIRERIAAAVEDEVRHNMESAGMVQ